VAGEAQEQLSLMAAPTLQGCLFGPADASTDRSPQAPAGADPGEADPDETGLDDTALISQAAARPRQRQVRPEASPTETSAADGSELPRWHHHSLLDPAALPPMLRHYVSLKAAHPDRVLLYRLGDFFEFFFEDALLLSRLLELTLTGKEAGKGIGRVPMAGIPSPRRRALLHRAGAPWPEHRPLRPTRSGGRQGQPAQAGHHPGDHPRHRAGGGHAGRPSQQLAGGGGGRAGPLGPGDRRCQHRRIQGQRAGGQRQPLPGAAAAGGR